MPSERAFGRSAGDADAWARCSRPGSPIIASRRERPTNCLGPDGRPREHWLRFCSTRSRGFGEADMDQRFASASRRIDEMGMTYRAPGEARERVAPLGRLPLLLPQAEWEPDRGWNRPARRTARSDPARYLWRGAAGRGRRAAGGGGRRVRPSSSAPMRGVTPAGGRWLRFYAAEIARGPDGDWRVLGDRAQAPSGAGYALENRLIMARAFPSLYRDMKVRRLAPFFRDFRAGLASARNASIRASAC